MKNPLFRLLLIIGVTVLLLMAGVASAGPRAFAVRRPMAPPREAPAQERAQVRPPVAQPMPAQAAQLQRGSKMSPEERRALRQQIQDDSRSVYRPYQPYQR